MRYVRRARMVFARCAYEELCLLGADEEASAAFHSAEMDRGTRCKSLTQGGKSFNQVIMGIKPSNNGDSSCIKGEEVYCLFFYFKIP